MRTNLHIQIIYRWKTFYKMINYKIDFKLIR